MTEQQHVPTAVTVERDGQLGIVSLNRPDRLNAFNAAMRNDFPAAMVGLLDDDAVKAILITGEGRAFCAGADLTETLEQRAAADPPPGGDLLRDVFNPLILKMVAAEKPIIAAVNGAAIGFGCSLALAADLVVAGRAATFSMAFTRLGAVPDGGSTYLLPRILGEKRAMAMLLQGLEIDAPRAEQWGLVNEVFDDDVLQSRAREVAGKLANGAALALSGVKSLVRSNAVAALKEHLEQEAIWQDRAFETSEFKDAITAFSRR